MLTNPYKACRLTGLVLLHVIFLAIPCLSFAQKSCEPNLDFGLGSTSYWTYYRGTITTGPGPGPGPVFTLSPCAPVPGLHTILSLPDTDYYGGFPVVGTGVYALKIGKDSSNYNADGASYYVHVPAGVTSFKLIYQYAVVFQNPGHTLSQQPRFQVTAVDSAAGTTVPGYPVSFVSSGSLPGFKLSPRSSIVWYKTWSTGSIELKSLAGKTATVTFQVGGCTLSGHWGYGYVSANCGSDEVQTACYGGKAILNAPVGDSSYKWTDSLTYSGSYGATQSITVSVPTVTTTYAVIVTPFTSYGFRDTFYSRVSPSNLVIHQVHDTGVCLGASVKIWGGATDITPLTYCWAPPTGLSCTTCDTNIVTPPAGNNSYRITTYDAVGCMQTDTIHVQAYTVPAAITGVTNVCIGLTSNLTDAAVGAVWSSSNTSVATIGSSTGIVTGHALGTATITYSFTAGCGAVYTTVTVNPLPSSITGIPVLCIGITTLLSDGPGTGIWMSGTTTIATAGSSSGVITGISAGTTTITWTSGAACPATQTVSVYAIPGAITGASTVCQGATTTCASLSPGGVWGSSNTAVATIGTAGVVSGISIGTSAISYTITTGCYVTKVITILPSPAPITGTPYVVAGATICITDATSGGSWATSDPTSATVGSTGCVYGVSGLTTCLITYTSTNGCRAVTTFSVTSGTTNDSMTLIINDLCNGPELTVRATYYAAGMYAKTDFGDGTHDSSIILPDAMSRGYVIIDHSYNTGGTYAIKMILYKGIIPIDTFTTSYIYVFCRTLPVRLYDDANGNCIMDAGENYLSIPTVTEVDSNGVLVDTISATSGFDYSAYCPAGTIYSFKLLSKLGYLVATCPSSGILNDTVLSTIATYPDKYFGLSCPGRMGFNLGLNAIVPVTGVNDQWGNIYINNTSCLSSAATVTLYFSPKWIFSTSESNPKPTTVSSTSATWNISSISSSDRKPVDIYYVFRDNPLTGPLIVRDTVNSFFVVDPIVGDMDTINNTQTRNDTIRASCDPNEMFVSPTGNILSCSPLQYTISFENTGNDTAHNVYIMDTLPENVDPGSLRIVMASADMNISMLKYGTHTVARFDFPAINLLDSSHHGLCDGVVIFNINALPGLADGATIFNHAGIFFDDNDVVMTDTVENIIGIQPITGGSSMCAGATDTLTDPTTGGIWKASNGNASVVNGVVTGITAGIDTISYTVSSSCSSETKTKTVTVNAAHAAPISGPGSVCNGSTIALTDASAGGVWSSSTSAIATISISGVVTGMTTGTATISYTVTNSCGTDVATNPISVDPLPKIYTVTGGGPVCAGSGTHVGISSSDAGVNYQLYNGTSKVGSLVAGTGIALDMGLETAAGTYTVKAVNATTACTSDMTGSAVIIINPLPSVYSVTGGGSICATDTGVHIGVSSSDAGVNYQLYNGTSKVGGIITGTGIALDMGLESAAGTYTVTAIDASTSCTNNMAGSAVITVIPSVTPSVSISSDAGAVICEGAMVNFTATPVNGGSLPIYLWSVNGTSVAGVGHTYSYAPVSGDVIAATLISNAVCAMPDTVNQSDTLTVTPLLKPNVAISASPGTFITPGAVVTLTANVTDGGAAPVYQWMINSTPVSAGTFSILTSNLFSEGDSVSCNVTSSGECGGYSSFSYVIIHVSNLGVKALKSNETVSVFPNPVTDELTIKMDNDAYNSFTITNSIGQVMTQEQLSGTQTNVDVKALAAGLYYITFRGDDGVQVMKFVKM